MSARPVAGNEFSRLIIPDNDEFLSALTTDRSINLSQVNQFETQAFRNKVLMLFKMRRTIQQNMSESGTHNHVVWDFVEGALQKKGSSGVTKIALYYFVYMRCEQVPDIDAHFQPFMDASMLGATNAPLRDEDIGGVAADTLQSVVSALSLSGGSRKTPRKNSPAGEGEGAGSNAVVAFLEKANENQTELLACLNEAAHDRKRKLELATTKMGIAERNNKFNRRLQIAMALNITDELTLLLERQNLDWTMRRENKAAISNS